MTIRGKWAGVLLSILTLSLVANLFVAGFAASRIYQFHHGHRPGMERMFAAFLARFPREIRHDLREEMREIRPEMRAAMDGLHQARINMIMVMRDPDLDRAELARSMNRVRERLEVVQTLGLEAVRRVVEEADPDDRGAIAPRHPRGRRGPPRD